MDYKSRGVFFLKRTLTGLKRDGTSNVIIELF